jgi:hypothetical protein
VLAGLVAACGPDAGEPAPEAPETPTAAAEPAPEPVAEPAPEPAAPEPSPAAAGEPTQLFWGDTHLHTSFSPDAYFFGNRTAGPDDAYRYAKGGPIVHPYHRARIRIETPLDFLVVADHAEMMGVPYKLFQGDPALAETETGKRLVAMVQQGKNQDVFLEFVDRINKGEPYADLDNAEVKRSIWSESNQSAERNNEPGAFTAFIGWEWTSTPDGKNLHRVVFTPAGIEQSSQLVPYSSFDSGRPEDLWDWLDETSSRVGADFIAIPHNSNISGGLMFDAVDSDGRPISADYARQRMRWEGVVEMTQIKGDSETHPSLSPNDEFADFESFEHLIDAEAMAQGGGIQFQAGDFARPALLRGLAIEDGVGVNPYKFGMIGATDSHTTAASAEEQNFHGKTAFDSTPENTFAEYLRIKGFGADMSAAGLAGVWAEANTRDSLFAAFKRKEVYATTGPRIRLRFFGGWDFAPADAASPALARLGYEKGVPMGGDLTAAPAGGAPSFLIHAAKDPKGANLDRVQVVKGWLGSDGAPQERVYDVVWSDGRTPGSEGNLPPVGNTVDLATGFYTNTIGDAQLATVWTDPDFDAARRAFYYVRVLQIPTPRHTLYDAIALGMDPAETGHPPTLQERAYSSPIWYTPGS